MGLVMYTEVLAEKKDSIAEEKKQMIAAFDVWLGVKRGMDQIDLRTERDYP